MTLDNISRMKEDLSYSHLDMDELDLSLIRELEQDARVSYLALASKLGTSHTTIRRRFKKLVDQGLVSIVAIQAYAALGYTTCVILAFNAPSGSLNKLAGQISAIDSIKYAWITTGRYDMLAMAWYRTPEEYLTAFPEEFGCIPKNVKLETMVLGKAIKSSRSYLSQTDFSSDVDSGSDITLSELDISVMKALEKSPRMPTKKLASDIGASLTTIRSSLQRLTSQGVIRIVSAPDPAVFGYAVSGITLIQIHPSSLEILIGKLKVNPSVKRMTLAIGAFNCIMWTSFQSLEKMSNFLTQDLGSISGVLHYETLVVLKVQKKSFSLMDGKSIRRKRKT